MWSREQVNYRARRLLFRVLTAPLDWSYHATRLRTLDDDVASGEFPAPLASDITHERVGLARWAGGRLAVAVCLALVAYGFVGAGPLGLAVAFGAGAVLVVVAARRVRRGLRAISAAGGLTGLPVAYVRVRREPGPASGRVPGPRTDGDAVDSAAGRAAPAPLT